MGGGRPGLRGEHHEGVQNPDFLGKPPSVCRSLPAPAAAQRRTGALLATLGLGRRVEHPRILQAVEPYPGRWTHHLLLTAPEDVDGLLAAWLAEAYRFAREKQRRA